VEMAKTTVSVYAYSLEIFSPVIGNQRFQNVLIGFNLVLQLVNRHRQNLLGGILRLRKILGTWQKSLILLKEYKK
jgi:hypothetical protein